MNRIRTFLKVISIILVLTTIAASVFYTELQEFTLKVKKYSQVNFEKNKGLHREALRLINKTASPFFSLETLSTAEVNLRVIDFLSSLEKEQRRPLDTRLTANIFVKNTNELVSAINDAKPGDEIFLQPGEYIIDSRKTRLRTRRAGEKEHPIVITALPETVKINANYTKALTIRHSYWKVENIEFVGVCDVDKACEHAIHIVGAVKNIEIKNNIFKNFNAHIKANGLVKEQSRLFPEFGVVENNIFLNEWVREVRASVTPIDVVGGSHWQIRNNFIADFSRLKNKGSAIGYSYGVFLKGASEYGVIEDNLVVCEWKLKGYSSIDSRIGISLGGGGTSEGMCQTEACEYEHRDGVVKNNQVLNCPNDVGIYLNKAKNSKVHDNVIVGSLGIDARYNATSGEVYNNVFQGRLKNRNGASVKFNHNEQYSDPL